MNLRKPPSVKLLCETECWVSCLNPTYELLGARDSAGEDNFQDIKPNLAKKLRQASSLPSHDLKALTTFIDALILKQQVKGE